MSATPVDAMADAAQWTAVRPDGTPSTDLAMHDETAVVGTGADGVSARVTAGGAAAGHALRRTIPAVDIAGHAELRLSLRADRIAGPAGPPFFLELRLGSAALPLSDPANRWHRLLPVREARTWETVRLSLDDLAPAVANGVTALQLRCVDAELPFTAYLDDLVAVTPELLADADRGIEARLAGITLHGGPVPVAVRAASEPAPAAPAVDVVQIEVRYATHRVLDDQHQRDFTTLGGRVARPGAPFDVDYAVSAAAATRADQAALIESVLDRLRPADELAVLGDRLPVDLVWIGRRDRPRNVTGPDPVLHYRVGVRGRPTITAPIRPVTELNVTTDLEEA
jgi:hypothetical protein